MRAFATSTTSRRSRPHSFSFLLAGLLCASVMPAIAKTYGEEARDRIRAAERVSPLSDGMFGDNINLYNGSVSFRVVDVSLPSNNGLRVEFARTLRSADASHNFFNIEVDVPRIVTILPESYSGGWTPDPPEVAYENGVEFEKRYYWQGFRLNVSGATESLLYRGNDERIVTPQIPGDFRFLSKSGWAMQVVPAASGVGSTVIGHAPDGSKYHFDHLISAPYGAVDHPHTLVAGAPASLRRKQLALFVTKVEDRFGNWVKYDWDGGKLLRIHASDDREIAIESEPVNPGNPTGWVTFRVTKVIANGREWSYDGQNVTNPDGSRWVYTYPQSSFNQIEYKRDPYSGCFNNRCLDAVISCSLGYEFKSDQRKSLLVSHPSGAKALYEFEPMRHGRTNVPFVCIPQRGDETVGNNDYNTFDDVWTLVKKTVYDLTSDAQGVQTQYVTTYAYVGMQPAYEQSAGPLVKPGEALPTPNYKTVTVTGPDRANKQYVFGRDWGLNEGRLLSTIEYSVQGVLMRRTDSTYMTWEEVSSQLFPLALGYTGVLFDDALSSYNLPVKRTVVRQDGVEFTKSVNSFDRFVRPTNVTSSSAPVSQ